MLERRVPRRDQHLKLAREAHARGDLVLAGAFAESMEGAVLVFRGDDDAAVKGFVAEDPYVANGLVTGWRIRPWQVGVGG
jgi:hypothetical protein